MTKTLTFKVSIEAPRSRVWDAMLGAETFTEWTAPFVEGAYFEGSWEKGSEIRFFDPNGNGMLAEIAENEHLELVSIRHFGEIRGRVEDTTSEAVRAWAPAYENYRFNETGTGTEVTVELDTAPEHEEFMLEAYPKALDVLKAMCESDK